MNDEFASPLLTAEEQAKFRSELLWELSNRIVKYNHGSGNSIPTEKAESILESMLYCVSAYLGEVPDPAAAVRSTSSAELFRMGLKTVENMVEKSNNLYRDVLATRIPTDLRAYNDTVDKGIPAFLQAYDPEFAAHETALNFTFDYPLLHPQDDKQGILYIINYLEEMKRENEFCAKYSENHIRAILLLHGQKHHLDYREMIVNIPELLVEKEQTGKGTAKK